MSTDKTTEQLDCQLQVAYEGAAELNMFDKIRGLSLRLASAIKRRCNRVSILMPQSAKAMPAILKPHVIFREGELVEILPLEEILRTLDKDNRYAGLEFMKGMEKHAGKQYRIFKKVRTIFDERQWRMLKIRDTVILKDLFCDGRDIFDKEGCDRGCFYFWKEHWLRKVEPSIDGEIQ